MRVVFCVASGYGLECLNAVCAMDCVELVGILTPPAQFTLKYEKNKTKEMTNPVYKALMAFCDSHGVPFGEMRGMNSEETLQQLNAWKPDLMIVSGWYHIIGKKALQIPPLGVIGLHGSRLPQYRGGSPLVWQMIRGEKEAGISLFYFDEGVDTGDIIAQASEEITLTDTIGTLYDRIGKRGIGLLADNLPLLAQGKAPRRKQPTEGATEVPSRAPQDGYIDWNQCCWDIYNFVRAQTHPYPGAFFFYQNKMVKVWETEMLEIPSCDSVPGTILCIDALGHPVIAAKDSKRAVLLSSYSCDNEEQSIDWVVGSRICDEPL